MLAEEIKNLIRGEVSSSPPDLKKYSEDASIFQVMPQVIAFPEDVEDLKKLVKFVTTQKAANPNLSITARSGGTDMSGGSLNDSVILDMTRHFNKIEGMSGKVVTTQPGVYYRDLEKLTLSQGLIVPSFPASKMICTVGGMVANNSGGEKSLRFGQTKNYVEELKAVLSDGQEYAFRKLGRPELEDKMRQADFEGQIYRNVFQLVKDNYQLIQKAKPTTSKNSSGYYLWDVWNKDEETFDLTQLLSGSQGTLGLITRIKLRLVHLPPKSELLVIFLDDLNILGELVHTVSQYGPDTFETYDKHTFRLAIKYLPSMIRHMKGNMLKLFWQFLPELWMTLTGGIPGLVLIAEFSGETEADIMPKIAEVRTELEKKFGVKTHVAKSEAETQKYWTIRRESFNLLRQHTKDKQTAPFVDDIIVHPDQLPEFLPQLNSIFARYPSLIYTIAGHAGDANFHIIPIMDLKDEKQRAIIPALSHEVYDLVLKYHGSISAEHNDGLIRTPYLEKMYGSEVIKLFAEVKRIFDPQDIFNPRKKVGATQQYALEHIKR